MRVPSVVLSSSRTSSLELGAGSAVGRDGQIDAQPPGRRRRRAGVIPSLEAARRNALFRLATLTGKPSASFARDLETCASPPRLTRPLPVGDGAALLKRRPDVRQAERQLAAATANIGVQTRAALSRHRHWRARGLNRCSARRLYIFDQFLRNRA